MKKNLIQFHRSGIQTRLILYYVVFALVTVALVAYFAYVQAANSLRATVEDKLETISELKVDFLDQWVDEQRRNLILLASLPELRTLAGELLNEDTEPAERLRARTELTQLVTLIAQRAADFQDVQILDRDGLIAISAAPRFVGRSQFGQPFFMEGQSRIYTQRFYTSDLFQQITLTISAPLFDDKNKLVGVLALHFNMRQVDGIIRADPQLNQPSQSYLITPSREIITDDLLFLARAPDFNSFAVTSALSGDAGTASYINHDGVAVIGRYTWIENQNAALIVEINEDAALAPARQLAVNILLAGLLVSIMIVLVVILLARRITAPLRLLTETVTRISQGDLEASVPPDLSNDEVGTLAQAFSSMTEKLRQTLAGLQAELHERRQTEAALLQFRQMMDETNEAIFLIDPETSRYLDFNRSAYEKIGYTRDELLQLRVMDIAQHLTNKEVWRERTELVRTQGHLLFDTSYRRKDGTTFPVEVSVRMLDYGDREVMVALARDITERRRSELALRESEEKFRKIFQSSPVAICITTLETGRLLEANYAYWDLTGYDPATSLGKNAEELKMWDVPEERARFVQDLRTKKSLFNPDDYFYHVDGSIRYVISFYELVRFGEEDCILAMFYDMSTQKQTMQALQQSEARTRALLEAIPDLIFEFSADGTFLKSVQPSTKPLFLPPEQFIGRKITEIIPGDVSERTLSAIQRALQSGKMETFEYQMSLNNAVHEYEARIVAISADSVLAIVRDITERKWAEVEREELINKLEVRNRESETLRNSLASIVTTFDLNEVVERILDQIKLAIPYDTASVWRVDGEWQTLMVSRDLPPEISSKDLTFRMDFDNSSRPLVMGEKPFVLNNHVQDDLPDFKGPHSYINSWLAVPLKKRGRIIGLIALDGRKRDQFTEHHAELAVTFANQVAIAFENADLFNELQSELRMREQLIRELEEKNAETETMRASLASIVGTFELAEVIQRILDQIRRVVPYDSASVWRLESNRQVLIGERDLPSEFSALGLELELDETNHAMPIFKGERSYIISADVQAEFSNFRVPPNNYIHSWLGVPLRLRGQVSGLIALDGRRKDQFTERHAHLAVTFADQVSIALENARLFSNLQAELKKQIALRSASMSISSSLHLNEVLEEICKQLCVINDGTSAYIAQYEKDYSAYTIMAEYIESTANASEKHSDLGTTYFKRDGAVLFDETNAQEYRTIHADDSEQSPWVRHIFSEFGGRSILYVPLYVQGRLLGHTELWDSRVRREFTKDEISFCRVISQQAAIAIANASLFEQLQTELRERKNLIAELESKNAELERFTYTVSHDLKSPLFTIRGFLGYLEQDALSGKYDRVKTDVQRIVDATEKMQMLLNDLLELSRVGRLKNESVDVPFEALVREAVELVQGRIMERGVTVTIMEGLPVVRGDRPRLLEVLQNLIDNAAKFVGTQSQPRIEIGQAGEEGGKPILYVRDNGIGILPEHFERVFGLFNKLDAKTDGTGIGLALVKRIIEVHEGRIWVESEVGAGTTFYFTLPAAPGQSVERNDVE